MPRPEVPLLVVVREDHDRGVHNRVAAIVAHRAGEGRRRTREQNSQIAHIGARLESHGRVGDVVGAVMDRGEVPPGRRRRPEQHRTEKALPPERVVGVGLGRGRHHEARGHRIGWHGHEAHHGGVEIRRRTAFELETPGHRARPLHGDHEVLEVGARNSDRGDTDEIAVASLPGLHLQHVPSRGHAGNLEGAVGLHHPTGKHAAGEALVRADHDEPIGGRALGTTRHASADARDPRWCQGERDPGHLLAGRDADPLRVLLRRCAGKVRGRVALIAVGCRAAPDHHHARRVSERRRHDVVARFEAVETKRPLIVGGVGAPHRHQPTPARHVAIALHLHRCFGERLAELVRDAARNHAAARQRECDLLDRLTGGDRHYRAAFADAPLPVRQRHVAGLLRGNRVTPAGELADFETPLVVGGRGLDVLRFGGLGPHEHAAQRRSGVGGYDRAAKCGGPGRDLSRDRAARPCDLCAGLGQCRGRTRPCHHHQRRDQHHRCEHSTHHDLRTWRGQREFYARTDP